MFEIDRSPELETFGEFALQFKFFRLLVAQLRRQLRFKHWDYSAKTGDANASSFALAERDQEQIEGEINRTCQEVMAALVMDSIDGNASKREVFYSGLDRLHYLLAHIVAIRSAFYRFSPALNRGRISQRSFGQSFTPRLGLVLTGELNRARSAGTSPAGEPGDFVTKNPTYGRVMTQWDFSDLHYELKTMFNIEDETQFALVGSGMGAEVVSNLLLQQHLGNRRLLVCDDWGRYYEHAWAKKRSADGVFALNTRENTSFVQGDPETVWPKILDELHSGGEVLIRADVVANDAQFQLAGMLSQDMLDRYAALPQVERRRLRFQIDTSLYPLINIASLHLLLPMECSVITVSSLNKFHQAGFDMGGAGMVTSRMHGNEQTPMLTDLMIYGGLSPSIETLCTLELICVRELIETRMRIIAANTKTLVEELTNGGMKVKSIAADKRVADHFIIGGLIALPKLGPDGINKLIISLAERGIQIDNRTSFGHNFTAIENVHQAEWSRLSVGIEDETTIRSIAKALLEVHESLR